MGGQTRGESPRRRRAFLRQLLLRRRKVGRCGGDRATILSRTDHAAGPRSGRIRRCGGPFPLAGPRSEEHTSELQSLMRISYAVFCLKKKTITLSQKSTTKFTE